MQTVEMISVNELCTHYQVELSFIQSLHQSGLLQVESRGDALLIPADEVPSLEKLARFYYEMDINLEGIETIYYLLQRVNEMQQEITGLKNKLSMYER